jgi:hypothetical protein
MVHAAVLSVIGPAITAWRDALRALHNMKAMAAIAFLLIMAVSALGTTADSYLFAGDEGGLAKHVMAVFFAVAHGFVATPLAIAVQRYLLLGEITQQYWLDLSSPRLLRFFVFAVAFYLVFLLPLGILHGLMQGGRAGAAWEGFAVLFLFFILVILALRTVILFPAIAVDAPGVSWVNALLDSRGHAWRISWLVLVTAAPMYLILILGLALMVWLPSWAENVIVIATESIATLFVIAVMAAAASRIYAAYGDRLGRPPHLRSLGSAAN